MKTSAGLARTPYVATVHARVCDCAKPPMELFTSGDPERAIKAIEGYWNVYLTFFGDQLVWLHFTVSDMRDGTVIWRDGKRLLGGKENGESSQGGDSTDAGRGATVGRWLVSGRPLDSGASGGPSLADW